MKTYFKPAFCDAIRDVAIVVAGCLLGLFIGGVFGLALRWTP